MNDTNINVDNHIANLFNVFIFFLSLTRHPFYYIKMQWFKTGTCMLRIILSNGDEQTLFLRVEIATWYSQFSNFPKLLYSIAIRNNYRLNTLKDSTKNCLLIS